MIRETRDLYEISKCFPMEKAFREKGYDETTLNDGIAFLVHQIITNPGFHFWLSEAEDDGEIRGYMVFTVNGSQLYINRLWTRSWDMPQMEQFKAALEEFSKHNNIKLWTMNARKQKTVELAAGYGFKPVSVVMERRVNNG